MNFNSTGQYVPMYTLCYQGNTAFIFQKKGTYTNIKDFPNILIENH